MTSPWNPGHRTLATSRRRIRPRTPIDLCRAFDPDLILYQAGVDGLAADALTQTGSWHLQRGDGDVTWRGTLRQD